MESVTKPTASRLIASTGSPYCGNEIYVKDRAAVINFPMRCASANRSTHPGIQYMLLAGLLGDYADQSFNRRPEPETAEVSYFGGSGVGGRYRYGTDKVRRP